MTPVADRTAAGPPRQDLHAHTTMSDGSLSLPEVVELARSRGVQIGIADHVSTRNRDMFVSSERELAEYLAALDDAPVLRSGEFCWDDALWRELPAATMDRFDYRVGSNHGFFLPDGSKGSPWWQRLPAPWDRRPQEVMDAMVDNLCELVGTMPIAIVAHSTLTPPALLEREPDIHAWWTPEREERFVAAVAESGVAMEISNRYRLPHDRLLVRALDAGVRFSLGSDGHTREQVARLEWSTETALRIGIPDDRWFRPERRDGRG